MAAFVQTQPCFPRGEPQILDKFVINVAIDDDLQQMKFLINTRANPYIDSDLLRPDGLVFTDVDYQTNTYTTLFIEVDFMGNTIFNKTERFCDLLAVKNTTDVTADPRLPGYIPHIGLPSAASNASNLANSKRFVLRDHENLDSPPPPATYGLSDKFPTHLLDRNVSLAGYFQNITGDVLKCPVYPGDSLFFYYDIDISKLRHKLGSYQVKFYVIAPNYPNNGVIGCLRIYVTPIQPKAISDLIFYATIALLVVTGLVNIFTIVNSSFQESLNPFLYRASTICNLRLLKQLDADSTRIIVYLQFALFLGGLDLRYPGFFQPFISQIRWCALIGSMIYDLHHNAHGRGGGIIPANRELKSDNVYITYNAGGLGALTSFLWGPLSFDIWPNFMIILAIWVAIEMVVEELFLGLKYLIDKTFHRFNPNSLLVLHDVDRGYHFSLRKNVYFLVGQFLHSVLALFGVPFLTLTTYLFYLWGRSNRPHEILLPSMDQIYEQSFASNGSYNLLNPMLCSELPRYPNGTLLPNVDLGSCKSYPKRHFDNATKKNLHSGAKVSIVLASILFVAWIFTVCWFVFRYLISFKQWRPAINDRMQKLYMLLRLILLWAFYYHHYRPDTVYFVAIEIGLVVTKLCIIGAIQNNGKIQVILLVILEVIDLCILFTIRPYYAPMMWYSTRWMLPVARFLVTILNIAFINELDISEANRTCVAYAQLLIHLIVAICFILNLIWCFGTTVVSIIRSRRLDDDDTVSYKEADLLRDFAYQPVIESNMIKKPASDSGTWGPSARLSRPLSAYAHWRRVSKLSGDSSAMAESLITDVGEDEIDLNNDEFYFRGTKTWPHVVEIRKSTLLLEDTLNDQDLFAKLQRFSNMRKKTQDYRVRESDRVYKKYLIDSIMDFEVHALWDSRFEAGESRYNPKNPQTLLKRAGSLIHRHPKTQSSNVKGFQVLRPRPLVIKTLDLVREESQS